MALTGHVSVFWRDMLKQREDHEMMSASSDASDSFLGYLYQLRFALIGGLKLRNPIDVVAVELLDDVVFANSDGTATTLHQLKHSVTRKASLGARSEDLWKTIGNWAQKVSDKQVDLDRVTLYLNTTGKVSPQSPLTHLKLHKRNESEALDQLLDAAASSTNDVVVRNAAKFRSLNKKNRAALLEQIVVVDSTANITEVADEIEHVLAVSSRLEDLNDHRRYLEGWFFDRAIRSLVGSDNRLIAAQEIRNQSTTIRDRLSSDRLPVLTITDVPSEEMPNDDRRMFVQQLQLINARATRIRRAQTEHFQALTQRSEWSREGKLAIEELPRFDGRLVTEWSIRHEAACINCENGDSEIELQEAELVYRWIEENAPAASQLFIRSSFSEPFLIRGSFHILSNRLAVGWHPRYAELLSNDPAE